MALSLFRKYRPETFAQFVGQEHVAGTLLKAIVTGNTADAYLFSGPRGTGKTSTARLVAKALLCEHAVDGEPDDSCEQCREISAGVHPDVYELDAASRTGVENVRDEIISRTAFAPIRGRYKIYIIDEVHMLSTAAFNALLKTLEEPPAHIKFILCTTDPQKVPQTIQSRCQRFDFHRFSETEIIDNLTRVSEAEGFITDHTALALIAAHANGGMRDALVALEQIAVYGSGTISVEAAESMFGRVAPEQLATITAMIAARNIAGCLAWVAELVIDGTDIAQFARELTSHLRDLYVASVLVDNNSASASQVFGDESLASLKAAATAFASSDRLSACLGVAAELNQQLKGTTDDRLALEMALIRMARPEVDLTLESLAARLDAIELRISEGAAGSAGAAGVVATVAEAASEPVMMATVEPETSAEPAIATAVVPDEVPEADAVAIIEAGAQVAPVGRQTPETAPDQPESAATPQADTAASATAIQNNSEAQRIWAQVISLMGREKQNRLVGLLDKSRVSLSTEGDTLVVGLPESSDFQIRLLEESDNRKAVASYVEKVHGSPVELEFRLGYTASSAAGSSSSD
jgi:DNA polymerase-3 subunit gamma/tau